jgi:hypothetical protein
VAGGQKSKARRFLQGLSADELQYIAEFLGSCILEHSEPTAFSRKQLADGIAEFERCRAGRPRRARPGALNDQEHKMILLLEYLSRCGVPRVSMAAHAGHQ